MLGAGPVDFSTKWSSLSDVVTKLLRCEDVSRDSWNSSFHDIFALCNSRPVWHAPTLYSSTTSLINARIKELVCELKELDVSKLLPAYVHHWNCFHQGLTCLDQLYRCVNQQYVKMLRPTEADMCYSTVLPMADRHIMEIMEVGLAFWKLNLVDVIKDRISTCLMREVLSDRLGISGQQSCIRTCLASFLLVGELRDIGKISFDLYNEIFQNHLLDATRSYYTSWASKRESELSCAQYITEALALRDEEERRAAHYYKCSFEEIQQLFQEIIVKQRLSFLNQSVRTAVNEENKGELRNLFLILERSDPYSELNHWFGEHVKTQIREAIIGLSRDINLAPVNFVESMLSICNRFIAFIDEVFDGATPFRNQLDKAFKCSINERVPFAEEGTLVNSRNLSPRPSELLCRYLDSLLRKSAKSLSETELDSKLTAAISVFKHINDKDVFQKYYQRMLCKRLLSNNSPVLEVMEETVINQLKAVCGGEFIGKFQRMFNDIQLAPELNQSFASYIESNNLRFPFRHHFKVLTQCSWPISLTNLVEFSLPVELQQCTSAFETFHARSHQGRKMRWVHYHHSTVDLLVLFASSSKSGDKPYQLELPALHAAIALLFDSLDVDMMTFGTLVNSLQLVAAMDSAADSSDAGTATGTVPPEQEAVQRALIQLMEIGLISLTSMAKSEPNWLSEASFAMDTEIALNRSFSNRRAKIRVTHGPTKETVQDEYGTAAYKTVELDTLLDDKAVQHREVDGFESDKFKNYFTTFQKMKGGYESGFRHVKPAEAELRLYVFHGVGIHHVELSEVACSKQSLNSDDVFILQTPTHLYQWNAQGATKDERYRASQYMHASSGKLKTEVIDETDKAESDRFKAMLPDTPADIKVVQEVGKKAIYSLSDATGKLVLNLVCEEHLPKSAINDNDVFFIDSGKGLYVYIGDNCSRIEKLNAIGHAHEYLKGTKHPFVPITVVSGNRKSKEMEKVLE